MTILDFGVGGGYGGRGADNGDFCYTPGCSPRQSATYGNLNQMLLAGSGGSGSSWNILFSGAGGGGGGGALEFVGETAINLTMAEQAGAVILGAGEADQAEDFCLQPLRSIPGVPSSPQSAVLIAAAVAAYSS